METNKIIEEEPKEETVFYSVKLINGMFFLILILSSGFVTDILGIIYFNPDNLLFL